MPILETILAGLGIAVGQGANYLDSALKIARLFMAFLFIIVSVYYVSTTPNFIDAVANKIIGYPVCEGKILGTAFCFAPSEKEWNSVLAPVWNGVTSIFNLDAVKFVTTFFTIELYSAIFIMLKALVLLSAIFYVIGFWLKWYQFAGSMIPQS